MSMRGFADVVDPAVRSQPIPSCGAGDGGWRDCWARLRYVAPFDVAFSSRRQARSWRRCSRLGGLVGSVVRNRAPPALSLICAGSKWRFHDQCRSVRVRRSFGCRRPLHTRHAWSLLVGGSGFFDFSRGLVRPVIYVGRHYRRFNGRVCRVAFVAQASPGISTYVRVKAISVSAPCGLVGRPGF